MGVVIVIPMQLMWLIADELLSLLYEPASRISKNHTTRLVGTWDLGLAQGQGEGATCEGGALGKVGGLNLYVM